MALSDPTGGAKLGIINTAVLTITDDEPTGLAFSAAHFSVMENGGTATITVSRSGVATGAVRVQYQAPGSSGTLVWASDDISDKVFTITLLNDAAVEGDETVNLVLTDPTAGATLGTPDTAELTIVDDE